MAGQQITLTGECRHPAAGSQGIVPAVRECPLALPPETRGRRQGAAIYRVRQRRLDPLGHRRSLHLVEPCELPHPPHRYSPNNADRQVILPILTRRSLSARRDFPTVSAPSSILEPRRPAAHRKVRIKVGCDTHKVRRVPEGSLRFGGTEMSRRFPTMSKRFPTIAILLLLFPLHASPFKSLIFYHGPRLTDEAIDYLSGLAREPKGADKVGKYLGKELLTDEGREEALLRIAIRNRIISEDEAMGFFSRLSGVNGFRSTLRKVIGNKQPKTQGHLNELRVADRASQHGFSIRGIGERFDDGIKNHPTDIDVVIEKNGKIFALEAKDYTSTTRIPLDQFRADMDSLVVYQSRKQPSKVIPVFSITRRPAHERDWKVLKNEAVKRGIKLIDGSPDEQAIILNYLETIP